MLVGPGADRAARHGVRHVGVVAVERAGVEQHETDHADEAHDRGADDPAPPGREQPAVREDEGDRDRPCVEQRPGRAIDLEPPALAERENERELDRHDERAGQHDPRNPVAGLPERDQEADGRRREEGGRDERNEPQRDPSPQPADVEHGEHQEHGGGGRDTTCGKAKPLHGVIFRLRGRQGNTCWHGDRSRSRRRCDPGARADVPRKPPSYGRRAPANPRERGAR